MRVKDKNARLDAGRMNQKIQIMRPPAATQNTETGAWTSGTPTTLCSLWASVNNLYGQEYWSARAMQQETTIVFTVFFHPAMDDLSSTDYIVWKGTAYDIQFPDDLNHENILVKIRAVKRS